MLCLCSFGIFFSSSEIALLCFASTIQFNTHTQSQRRIGKWKRKGKKGDKIKVGKIPYLLLSPCILLYFRVACKIATRTNISVWHRRKKLYPFLHPFVNVKRATKRESHRYYISAYRFGIKRLSLYSVLIVRWDEMASFF